MDNRFARKVSNVSVQVRDTDGRHSYRSARHPPLTDYTLEVAAAIAWLGERYLLARPVNVARTENTGRDPVV
jgi:hypothetical protein